MPYVGLKAQTYRYIYAEDGTHCAEKQDMGVSSYKMRPTTILYNPADGDPSQPASKPETPATDPGTGTDPGAGTSNPGTGTATPAHRSERRNGRRFRLHNRHPGSSAGTDPGGERLRTRAERRRRTPGPPAPGGTGSSSSSGAEEPPVSQDVQAVKYEIPERKGSQRMFQGFSQGAVDFLWSIRFNNERSWFLAHKEEYLTLVDRPMRELGDQVHQAMEELCPELG